MDQVKKAFKGLFNKKKPTPTAATEEPTASHAQPTETTPAAPAPATAPELVQSEGAPSTGTAPAAAPAAAPAQGESNQGEAAALAEVKQATQSRSTSLLPSETREHGDEDCYDGSRRRQKVALDSDWHGPL